MKPTTDDATPLSASYRETYRRHRVLCWVPIVLGAAAAALILFTSASSYRSTASLWIDTAPSVSSSIGASGNSTLAEPPAASEQGILTELLTTNAFAQSVAHDSLLGRRLGGATDTEAPRLLEHDQVTSQAAGEQILNVSYTGSSPAETQSVLSAIVAQLQSYNDNLASQHGQASLAYDQEQVKLAEAAVAKATDRVKSYLATHSGGRTPTYLSLSDAETNAVAALGQANTTLNQATGSSGSGGWVIRVLDSPSRPVSHAASKKKMVAIILGGAFGGLLVSLLAVIALTPARREEREERDAHEAHEDRDGRGTRAAATTATPEADPATDRRPTGDPAPVGDSAGPDPQRPTPPARDRTAAREKAASRGKTLSRDKVPSRDKVTSREKVPGRDKAGARDKPVRREKAPRRESDPRRERVPAGAGAGAGASREDGERGSRLAPEGRAFVLGFNSESTDAR